MVLMYLRKSRADSPDSTVEEVLAKHEAILQEFCIREYGKPLEQKNILREVVSGETISDRPMMTKLMSLVAKGNVREVVVIEPQRLSRGDLRDCGTLIRVFEYSNTKIKTPTKTFDLADKYDKRFLIMTLQQGNDFLEYFKEITARGRIASVKKGCYLGNTAPYGYTKVRVDKLPTLEINEDEAPYVRLMYELCCKGYGVNKIANELNRRGSKPRRTEYWSNTSVKDILRNETYTGKVRWYHRSMHKVVDVDGNIHKEHRRNKEYLVVDGLHPAIIEETVFQAAQNVLGSVSREVTDTELKNIFAGLLKCQCGYSYIYRSYSWARPRLHCSHQKFCHSPSVVYDDFLAEFIETLKSVLPDKEIEGEIGNDNTANLEMITSLKHQLAELENKQLKLYQFLESGTYSEDVFNKRNAALDEERQRLNTALSSAKAESQKENSRATFSTTVHLALETLADDSYTAKSKNNLLKSFIDRIEITDKVDIYFK